MMIRKTRAHSFSGRKSRVVAEVQEKVKVEATVQMTNAKGFTIVSNVRNHT